jgi:predicted DNA-binding protein (MmcQ/YjbR family)
MKVLFKTDRNNIPSGSGNRLVSNHNISALNYQYCLNIDIRLSKPQQEEALRTHMAIPHQYAPQAGWVSCILETKEQADNTKRLIKQAYDTCVSLKTSHKPAN